MNNNEEKRPEDVRETDLWEKEEKNFWTEGKEKLVRFFGTYKKPLSIALVVAILGGGGIALAEEHFEDHHRERHEKTKVVSVKLSQEEGKKAALQFLGGGTVKDVELESRKGRGFYEVEVEKDGQTVEVYVDGETGKIFLPEKREKGHKEEEEMSAPQPAAPKGGVDQNAPQPAAPGKTETSPDGEKKPEGKRKKVGADQKVDQISRPTPQ